jgi:myo-inositol 2-dehydrogenase / D-chiro-inositol 1-dehydrogenase
MTVRFAVLGAGRIGKVHAGAIASVPGAALTAIADPMPAAAEAIRGQYGAEVRSIEAILASTDVDAIVICTPTDTHADLIEAGVKSGKAVFCEKPVDLSLPRVIACAKVVAAHRHPVMVGFNRRFDPDFMAVKAAIDAGRVGTVEMVTITSRDPGAPPVDYIKRSGGIFRDMTIHDFDMARWLLGEEPEAVMATAAVLTDPAIGAAGDFDSVNVLLRTATGKQAVITNSRRATYGYDQRIEVLGSKGMAAAKNTALSNTLLADAAGFQEPPLLNFFMTRYTAAYAAEIAAFVASVAEGRPTPTTVDDGLKALALADAAVRSVAERRLVTVAEVMA